MLQIDSLCCTGMPVADGSLYNVTEAFNLLGILRSSLSVCFVLLRSRVNTDGWW